MKVFIPSLLSKYYVEPSKRKRQIDYLPDQKKDKRNSFVVKNVIVL